MKGPGQIPTGETLDFYGKVLELHVWTMNTAKGGYGIGWFRGGAELLEAGYGDSITEARADLDERMKGNYPALFKEYPSTCQYQHCTNYRATGFPYCHTHLKGLRDLERDLNRPVKPVKGLKRTPVNKVSTKRAFENGKYSVERGIFLEDKVCEACGDDATEIHHKAGRENHLLMDKQYWMAVCRPCHQLITEDSAWAISQGYSISRTKPGAAANPVKDKTI